MRALKSLGLGFSCLLLLSLPAIAAACDNRPLPLFLVGVWGTEESLFIGDTLVKGEAIYIGPNGCGVLLNRGDNGPVLAARLQVLEYDSNKEVVTFDIVRNGKILAAHKILAYDTTKQWLVFSDTHFYRRFDLTTAKTRSDLGLPP